MTEQNWTAIAGLEGADRWRVWLVDANGKREFYAESCNPAEAQQIAAHYNACANIPNPAAIADVVAALEAMLEQAGDGKYPAARHALASVRGEA
jgi:acetyl esterase/lipase